MFDFIKDMLLALASFLFAALCVYLGNKFDFAPFYLLGMFHMIGFMYTWPTKEWH